MNDDLIPQNGGDLAPYSPSAPLAPSNDWLVPSPEPDFIGNDNYQTGSAPKLFGQDVPDMSSQQLNQVVNEITQLFSADSIWQKGDRAFVTAVADWYRQTAFAPTPREYVNHSYDLRGFTFPPNDQAVITAFCNFCSQIGATEKQVKTALAWYAELIRRVNQFQQTQRPQESTELSDAEWAQLERRCERDYQKAEAELKRLWGFQYQTNLAIANRFLNNLPADQREHICNDVLADGTLSLNSSAVVIWLHEQALGGVANLRGGDLAKEISRLEKLMASGSPEYWKSEESQSRLRMLYDARDGG